MTHQHTVTAHRGEILHLLGNPAQQGDSAIEYFADGILLIEDGHIVEFGPATAMLASLDASISVMEHPDSLLIPGFIDTHIHYPQTDIVAAHGKQLLDWLNTYTFPAERQFDNQLHAEDTAAFFLDELVRNGTTTAMVFGTVHPQSVDTFFQEAEKRNLRMMAGKVMMDRNAPDYLCDDAESSYRDSRKLIEKWHEKGRLAYAVTPRFAPTSSEQQLQYAGQLLKEFPSVYLQTHVAENTDECAWVQSLFPQSRSYLDVYDQFGLLGERSVFGHAIHLDETDWQRLADTGSAVSFCPCSNLFIGSGLFRYAAPLQHGVKTGLATDVAGGDSFSMLRVINEAYKIQQLTNYNLDPFQALYLATLGGACSLDVDDKIGNFAVGKEADFLVLDYNATPLIRRRVSQCKTLKEKLFALLMLGDDRLIQQTWVMGLEQKGQTWSIN